MVKLKRKKKPPDRLEKMSQVLQSASEVGFARFQALSFFWKTRSVRFSCCFAVFVSLIASGGAGLSGERSGGPVIVQFWKSAPIFVQIWKSAPSILFVLWCFGWVLYDWRVVWHSSFSFYSSPDLVNDGGVSSAGVFSVYCDCSGLFWTFGVYLRAVLSLFLLPGVVQFIIRVQACGSSRNGGNEAQLAAYFISGGSCLSLKGEQFRIWSWKFPCVMFFGLLPVLLVSSSCLLRLGPVRMGDENPASSVFYFVKLQSVADGRAVSDLELAVSTRGVFWIFSGSVGSFFLSLSVGTWASGVCYGAPYPPCRLLGKHSKMKNVSGGAKISHPSSALSDQSTCDGFPVDGDRKVGEMRGSVRDDKPGSATEDKCSWQWQEGPSPQFTPEDAVWLEFEEFHASWDLGKSQCCCGSSSAIADSVCNGCLKACLLPAVLRCEKLARDGFQEQGV